MGFDLGQLFRDVAETAQQNASGGLRMAGDFLMGLPGQAVQAVQEVPQYLKEIPQKGFIPILPTAVSKDARTGAGYLKSMMGPAGMPLRILDNPGSSDFYQRTINAAKYDPASQTVTFNENIDDLGVYDELGRDLSNKDCGRYVGDVMPDGSVIVDDDYDTNRSALWHYRRLKSGKDDQGNPLTPLERAISGASGMHKKLEQAGWTNPHPFGAPGSVKLGTYQR